MKKTKKPKFTGTEWSIPSIQNGWDIIKKLAKKYNWNGFPVQFEIVSAEQMLDAYSSHGLPVMYSHWSFGKDFVRNKESYEAGHTNLAYELIVNTNPSICYIMEDNTQMMQLLVTAHAAVGHNHFFKHNYLFKEWTNPKTIVGYLEYAKRFITECETEYGAKEVEKLLDAAHALELHSVFKYKRKYKSAHELEEKKKDRIRNLYKNYDKDVHGNFEDYKNREMLKVSKDVTDEENILWFIAENSPILKDWQREVLKITCNIAQYFYPQRQTKVLNEGFASFVHYTLMNDLYDQGYIDEGYILEFLQDHSNVTYQPKFNKDKSYTHSINPYNLGFNLFMEIKRICEKPTEEDKEFCPMWAGKNWLETVNFVVENYNDESAILDFLTPNLIRKFKLFNVTTNPNSDHYLISNTHTNEDHKIIRQKLSRQYNLFHMVPDVSASMRKDEYSSNLILRLDVKTFEDNDLEQEHLYYIKDYLHYLWGRLINISHVKENGEVIEILSTGYDADFYFGG